MLHYYENHLGGFYSTPEKTTPTICDECGETDTYMGEFENPEAFAKYIKEQTCGQCTVREQCTREWCGEYPE